MKFLHYFIIILLSLLVLYHINNIESFENVYVNSNNKNGFLHSRSTFSKIYDENTVPRCADNNLVNEYNNLKKLSNFPSNNVIDCPDFKYDGVYNVN